MLRHFDLLVYRVTHRDESIGCLSLGSKDLNLKSQSILIYRTPIRYCSDSIYFHLKSDQTHLTNCLFAPTAFATILGQPDCYDSAQPFRN